MTPSSAHVIPSAIQKTSVANSCFFRGLNGVGGLLGISRKRHGFSWWFPKQAKSRTIAIPAKRRHAL